MTTSTEYGHTPPSGAENIPPAEDDLHWLAQRARDEIAEGDSETERECRIALATIAEVRRLRAERSAVWLIEHIRGANGAPLWWCGSIPPFSADPNSAVRFVRERDAHVVMVQENIQNSCRATEHVFLDAARQEPTT